MRYGEFSIPDVKIFHSSVLSGKRVFREHHHTECELSMIRSGSGTYTVKDRTYSFSAGDIFLFGSNEIHCITDIDRGEQFDLINIHFEPRILWNNGEASALQLLRLFFDRNDSFTNKLDPENPVTAEIQRKIADIETEFTSSPPGYELKIKIEIYSVLLLILRSFGYVDARTSASAETGSISRLASAMDYINSHLYEDISLDDIAKHTMLSRTYFSALFRKYNGLSPWEYITIKRVEKAIELLRTTNMTKMAIASQCGFNSSSNFYKAFGKITGKTPDHYQK